MITSRRTQRRIRATGVAIALALCFSPVAGAQVDASDIEDEVVCIQCERPLSTSSGSAADDQRAFISRLVEQGLSKDEIKDRLVDEYGERVLVDDGSPVAAAAPWVAGVAGLGAIGVVLTRRRRSDGDPLDEASPTDEAAAAPPAPSAGDEARIDAELAELED